MALAFTGFKNIQWIVSGLSTNPGPSEGNEICPKLSTWLLFIMSGPKIKLMYSQMAKEPKYILYRFVSENEI